MSSAVPSSSGPDLARIEERLARLPAAEQDRVRRLLAARVAAGQPGHDASGVMPGELGFSHERLWVAHELSSQPAFFNCPLAVRLSGPLDTTALELALGTLTDRHRVLRHRVVVVDGRPRFAPDPEPAPPLPVAEMPGASAQRVREAVIELADEPFDLSRRAPLRATLLRLGAREHVLVLVLHHTVTDDHSEMILLAELGALYAAQAGGRPHDLPPIRAQVSDLARRERKRMAGPWLDELLERWRVRFDGCRFTPALPGGPGASATPAGSSRHLCRIPAETADRLATLAREERASVSAALLGLARVLLGRHAGCDDLVIAVPAGGRTRAEHEPLIGYFINILPIRSPVHGGADVRALIRAERDAMLAAYGDQELPFQLLADALSRERGERLQIFQVHYNHVHSRPAGLHFGPLAAQLADLDGAVSHFPLGITSVFDPAGGGLTLSWVYDPAQVDGAFVADLAERFAVLAKAAAAQPDRPVGDLSVLTGRDEAALAALAHAPHPGEFPGLLESVRRAASLAPAHVAVDHAEQSMDYARLIRSSGWLAGRLRAAGLERESVAAVLCARTVRLPAILLGVLAAGLAYLPLDPDLPAERLAAAIAGAGARALVTDGTVPAPSPDQKIVIIDVSPPAWDAAEPDTACASSADLAEPHQEQLAYVLFTSGSTGVPKGVCVTYGALSRLMHDLASVLPAGAADRTLALTTVGFDISAVELLFPLASGGTVLIPDLADARDGRALVDAVGRLRPTLVQATPAGWRLMALAGWPGSPGLYGISGGERLPPELANTILRGTRGLWNGYGPTEATIYATGHALARPAADGTGVPIGVPMPSVGCRVLDAGLRQAPPGVPGELYLGGPQLARCYLGQPGLTAERFVPDPYGPPGARAYRTGDVVRLLADGALDFLGRSDRQAKVRGFRVEPAEAEAALLRDPAVREAVVVVRRNPDGDATLSAYVTPEPGRQIDTAALRAALIRQLPGYLVPSLILAVEAIPRTPSGKYDAGALPVSLAQDADGAGPDLTPAEHAVAARWRALLGVDPRPDQDFFALGGHSLTVMRLAVGLEEDFGLPVRAADLYARPTVAAQADYLDELTVAEAVGLSGGDLSRYLEASQ